MSKIKSIISNFEKLEIKHNSYDIYRNIPLWYSLTKKYFDENMDPMNMDKFFMSTVIYIDEINQLLKKGYNTHERYENKDLLYFVFENIFKINKIKCSYYKSYIDVNKNLIIFLLKKTQYSLSSFLILFLTEMDNMINLCKSNDEIMLSYDNNNKQFYCFNEVFNKKDIENWTEDNIVMCYNNRKECLNVYLYGDGKIGKNTYYYEEHKQKLELFQIKCLNILLDIFIEIINQTKFQDEYFKKLMYRNINYDLEIIAFSNNINDCINDNNNNIIKSIVEINFKLGLKLYEHIKNHYYKSYKRKRVKFDI